ncbi:hypothetical protein CDAR_73701 [Caerostris darwini]|uniref:RNA polymerase alpha subunit n=1 Tax=Caerostris darwini TaxID=1538125 RepID=A0AAV4MSE8_9ARAC|nr:hypothetical protein CDAR_73701 [Caerostris darwini]
MITPKHYRTNGILRTSKLKWRLTPLSLRKCDSFRELSPDISFPCRISVQDLILDMGILVPKRLLKGFILQNKCHMTSQITPKRYQTTRLHMHIKIETATYSAVSQKARLIPDIFFPCRISVQDLILDMGILVPEKISKKGFQSRENGWCPLF